MKNIIVKELKKHIPQNIWEFLKAHKAMLAGGAITSILTKKEINDFGIYCQKGYPYQNYGSTFLEVEPLKPSENSTGEGKFGYKEGVLVKQVLPFNTEEGYYTWLEEVKEVPSKVIKYLKLLKGN